MEKNGVQCWIAPRDVPAGKWGSALIEAVTQSRIMALIFSTNANKSINCLSEVHTAFTKNITIIPLKIDDTVPSGDMEYYLQTFHWLDAHEPPLEKRLSQLVDRIKYILKEQFDAEKRSLAVREAQEAAERVRQQTGEDRKAKEAEEKASIEVQRLLKEKEQREAQEAAERSRQQLIEARKAKEVERLAKKKEQQEAKKAIALARLQARKVHREAHGFQLIIRSIWFWVGILFLVVGLCFTIIIPAINMPQSQVIEGLRAGLGVMLFSGVFPTAIGIYLLWRRLVRGEITQIAWLRIGDVLVIIGVIFPFVLLSLIALGTNEVFGSSRILPEFALSIPILLGASLSFAIPAIFSLRRGLIQEILPNTVKLTQIRRIWVRLALQLISLSIPIVFASLISQSSEPSVGLGMMLIICSPLLILSTYYFWRGVVKNRLNKTNYLWLAGIYLLIGFVLPIILLGILTYPGETLPSLDLMLPPVFMTSPSFIIMGIYCLIRGLNASSLTLL